MHDERFYALNHNRSLTWVTEIICMTLESATQASFLQYQSGAYISKWTQDTGSVDFLTSLIYLHLILLESCAVSDIVIIAALHSDYIILFNIQFG